MALNLAKGIIFPCKAIFSDSPIKYKGLFVYCQRTKSEHVLGFPQVLFILMLAC